MTEAQHLRDASGKIVLREEDRQTCLVFSRVMGYLAPTILWNAGK